MRACHCFEASNDRASVVTLLDTDGPPAGKSRLSVVVIGSGHAETIRRKQ